ncbi:MAG TPA: protein kinase [Bryobacteraceae bacterium]
MSAPSAYPERQKEIFGLALDLPPEDRAEFLARECGADQRLYDAVMEMIRKHDALDDFLEAGPNVPGSAIPTDTDPPPVAVPIEFHGNERFQLTRRLGSGGFGTVFEASDCKERTRVALKVLNRPQAAELRMFKREFRSLAEITHPNLVQLYELIEDGRHWFFTMELVEGADFVSYVRAAGRVDYGRLRAALRQLTEAVDYLHRQKMLHRDIKPANIRVTAEGEVKLLDFGLVRDVSHEFARETITVGGTAAYMAPELLQERTLREASDWYSVGAVLYEAVTGQPPFPGGLEVLMRKNLEPAPPPRRFAPDLPDDLNDLCLNLVDRDPAVRLSGPAILDRLAGPAKRPHSVVPTEPAARPTPLIGRQSHLAALREAFDEVRSGRAVCVHIYGQSGMGKSALCKRFLGDARREGAVVLAGRCYEGESVPFKALDPIVDALGDYLKTQAAADVAAFLPRERPLQALSRVFPTLGEIDAIGRQRVCPSEEPDPHELQRQAIAALKEILARVAEKFPCVIHIDDLQWGDLDSVQCLAGILAPPDPPRVLFLFSYRSEDVASSLHLQRLAAIESNPDLFAAKIRELEVDRLTPAETRQLAEELLGGANDLVHQWIDRETEGMPLFIHELALHARSGLASGLPQGLSLQEIIRTRVSALPVPSRRMLEIVSLAAQPVSVDAIRQAAGLEEGEHSVRNVLVAQKLIRFRSTDTGGEVEPYHDKIREAVAGALTADVKRQYFGALAETLEERPEADAEIVYQYFLAAGNREKAQAWVETAAERAEGALAFDRAVRLREERIEMGAAQGPERSLLLERLAIALSFAGRGLKAAQTYQAAAQSAPPDKHRDLIRKAGEQYIRSGHFVEGQALLRALLERAGVHIPKRRWQALLLLVARRAFLRLRGLGFHTTSGEQVSPEEAAKLDICRVTSLAWALADPIRAAELQSRHLLYSLRLGEPYRIANSLAMEAGYVAARGGARGYPEAARLLDRVEELGAQSNHPNGRTLALSVRSKVAWFAGRWEESAKFGEQVNRLATEQYTRVAWEAYPSSIFWMCSLACMGRWREVMDHLPGLQADSQARGDLLEMTSLPVFTFAYMRWLLSDQPERAAAELENAQARLTEPGFIPHRFGVWYGLADVALYTGDTERAQRAIRDGMAQLERTMALRLQSFRILMLHARARVACASAAGSADGQTTSRFLADAASDARRIRKERADWGNAVANAIDAAVAAEEHRDAEARLLWGTAEAACLRTGMAHFAAAAQYRKAQLLEGDAREHALRQADVWFAAQRVARPERIVHLLSPGSRSLQ